MKTLNYFTGEHSGSLLDYINDNLTLVEDLLKENNKEKYRKQWVDIVCTDQTFSNKKEIKQEIESLQLLIETLNNNQINEKVVYLYSVCNYCKQLVEKENEYVKIKFNQLQEQTSKLRIEESERRRLCKDLNQKSKQLQTLLESGEKELKYASPYKNNKDIVKNKVVQQEKQ